LPIQLIKHTLKKSLLFIACCLLALSSCFKNKKQLPEVVARDTSITLENSFSELFLDSARLSEFMSSHPLTDSITNQMQSFYNGRNYQYAWFFPDGMADFVTTFLNLQNDYIYYSGDSSLYNTQLVAQIDSLRERKTIHPTDDLVLDTELRLTRQFFYYTNVAYSGDRSLNIQELDWYIPRRKVNPEDFLDSLLKNKGQNVAQYEPVNQQYNLLKQELEAYSKLDKKTAWTELVPNKKSYAEGDSAEVITEVKKRLHLLNDFPETDTSSLATPELKEAVQNFQIRFGLKSDGVMGISFFSELNVPLRARIRQMLINMERIRWMPAHPTTDYLLVNIPDFRLHVYEKAKLAFSMNVVVGSTVHTTVIFSGMLNQIVFSPYWNIPPSILNNEILPGIKKNPNYLDRHNMEWNGNSVRQKPGKNNSLGLVKFLFPNSYNIYLHDTPSKSLFGESRRAFSHGCIRLSEPKKLAEFLLRNDSTWTEEKIMTAMNAGTEKYVRLKGTAEVPVFIGYFTSWVDKNGRLNFRDDIYGHDKKMAKRLFKETY
jgi:murein L,D-transpeptidase YcbB/YkuD